MCKGPTQYQPVPQSQYSTVFAMQFAETPFHREDNTCQSVSETLDFIFALLKEKIDLQGDAFIFNKKHSYTLISHAAKTVP